MKARVNMKVRVRMMKHICIIRYPNLIISIDAISVTQLRIYRIFYKISAMSYIALKSDRRLLWL